MAPVSHIIEIEVQDWQNPNSKVFCSSFHFSLCGGVLRQEGLARKRLISLRNFAIYLQSFHENDTPVVKESPSSALVCRLLVSSPHLNNSCKNMKGSGTG